MPAHLVRRRRPYTLLNRPDDTSGGGAVEHTWNLSVNRPTASAPSARTLRPVAVDGTDVANADVTVHGPTPLLSAALAVVLSTSAGDA